MVAENILIKNLLIIHQQSGFRQYKNSINFLNSLASNIKGRYKITVIVADNNIEKYQLIDGVHVMPCSNRFREFSAWSEALVFGKELIMNQACNLILSNETMLTHRPFDSVMKNAFVAAFNQCFENKMPAYAGDVDKINAKPPYYHSNNDLYVSTYLCGMNWGCIQLFDSIIPRADYEENFILSFKEDSVFSKNCAIKNTDYGLMLEGYLYKSVPNMKIKKWWDYYCLNENNFHKFRLKLLSLLIEAGISQNVQEKGCILIDIKKFTERNFFQLCKFYFKKIYFGVVWRLNRYRKMINNSL
jgi:hypothetical protein